jgi:cytochrome P450
VEDLFAQGDSLEGWWPEGVRRLLGSHSLANRQGPGHRARRRVVGQLFTAAALRRYAPAIVELVNDLCRELAASREPVVLAGRLRRFAFAVIAGPVLGLDAGERDALFLDFETWTRGLFSIPVALPGSRFARALQARRRLLDRIGAVLRRSQEAVQAGRGQGAGGLDLLAGGLDEAGLPLGDADVEEQLLLLLFAGYETTASSLVCLQMSLLQHPVELAWLSEELQQIPWPPAADGAATACDPARAPRLDAVVKEVMRLIPPVGGFFRHTTRPVILAGVEIPADRVVQVSIAATHRLGAPEQDLESFRPRRHLEPGGCGALLLPFGGGERVCLGKSLAELEIRLLSVGVLKQLELRLVPDQDLGLAIIPSPTPRDGLRVTVNRR